MKTQKIPKERFEKMLKNVDRIWDGQQGLGKNQAKQKGIDISNMQYIYVRADGWSISAEKQNSDSCYDLWSDEWIVKYEREEADPVN